MPMLHMSDAEIQANSVAHRLDRAVYWAMKHGKENMSVKTRDLEILMDAFMGRVE